MMWPKIKCWLSGHQWKQFGISKIEYLNEQAQKVRFETKYIFVCQCCHEIWEYTAGSDYYNLVRKDENDGGILTPPSSVEPSVKD